MDLDRPLDGPAAGGRPLQQLLELAQRIYHRNLLTQRHRRAAQPPPPAAACRRPPTSPPAKPVGHFFARARGRLEACFHLRRRSRSQRKRSSGTKARTDTGDPWTVLAETDLTWGLGRDPLLSAGPRRPSYGGPARLVEARRRGALPGSPASDNSDYVTAPRLEPARRKLRGEPGPLHLGVGRTRRARPRRGFERRAPREAPTNEPRSLPPTFRSAFGLTTQRARTLARHVHRVGVPTSSPSLPLIPLSPAASVAARAAPRQGFLAGRRRREPVQLCTTPGLLRAWPYLGGLP